MKVEVGDWVRFRGGTRIHEVYRVHEQGDPRQTFIETTSGSRKLVSEIDQHAEKFWIKKAGDE